ncbi:hypothetical protein [Mesobacillus thioparans]|uniref:hypothetical protein n=1 Tax=Mesobacillus thioparans TaxID=370439 RepID=UPI0039EEC932
MNTKRALWFLAGMDLLLVVLHMAGYFFLFLKPTGYLIPLAVNGVVLAVTAYRSSGRRKLFAAIGVVVIVPAMLIHGLMLLVIENHYTNIESPWDNQSVVIEYRFFSLGETTYQYHFYKTRVGLIGNLLEDESITMVVQGTEHPGLDAEGILGVDMAEWVTESTIRFPAWKGMKEVHLGQSKPGHRVDDITGEIETFMKIVEKKENGHTIMVNGNRLTSRYDEATGESWIDVTSEGDKGPIPRQQCTRIVPNQERGYYMLEECTHQWEYPLFPLSGD